VGGAAAVEDLQLPNSVSLLLRIHFSCGWYGYCSFNQSTLPSQRRFLATLLGAGEFFALSGSEEESL